MLSWRYLKIVCIPMAVVVAVVVGITVFLVVKTSSQCDSQDTSCLPDVTSTLTPSNTTLGVYSQAAVVSLGSVCADIGRSMLVNGGNAVDAAIATLLCDGVCVMQSMGVGGGFIMTLYNKTEGKTYSIIARETAPAAATQDMYVNDSDSSLYGALAAAVPGELKGYQEVHTKFGKLPWSDLFQPTISLCEEGVPVNKALADQFIAKETKLRESSTFVSTVLNSTGGELPKAGSTIKLPLLAKTLRVIANSSIKAEELYNGSLTKQFVADIQAGGGIITEEDMNNYSVRWEEPYNASISGNFTVLSAALPGSGVLVTFMLRLLDGLLQYCYSDIERSLAVIEAFKHAYGRRTDLGDPYFVNATLLDKVLTVLTDEASIQSIRAKIKIGWTSENVSYYGADYAGDDHGTDNIVVVDQEGTAISVTSTINTVFGSKFVSTSTGIILNNEMDDFSTPGSANIFGLEPSQANYIVPGKRPLSSMSPTVVLDSQGDVRLVVGAAGGSAITTQVTNVAIKNLWYGKNIKESIDDARYHHQLKPMRIFYEYGVLQDMVSAWLAAGHETRRFDTSEYCAVATGIARLGDNLTASVDRRKPGQVAGL